jgi:hypothetical protein
MKKIKKDIETGEISNEQQAAKVLLDEGVKFKIKGLGSYEIKPLKLCTLVEISKDALKIPAISEAATAMNVIATAGQSAKICARIVAKAILRDRYKMKFLSGRLTRKLYNALTAEELNNLVLIIIKQSGADFFFSSTSLISSMRIMKPTT